MYQVGNETKGKKNKGMNRTALSGKNQKSGSESKLQKLENIGSTHHQKTEIKEKT